MTTMGLVIGAVFFAIVIVWRVVAPWFGPKWFERH
jgi:hypothetical protein